MSIVECLKTKGLKILGNHFFYIFVWSMGGGGTFFSWIKTELLVFLPLRLRVRLFYIDKLYVPRSVYSTFDHEIFLTGRGGSKKNSCLKMAGRRACGPTSSPLRLLGVLQTFNFYFQVSLFFLTFYKGKMCFLSQSSTSLAKNFSAVNLTFLTF